MKLVDTVTEQEYSLSDLFYEWLDLRAEDPWNHSIHFPTEFLDVLMATINGRNDLDIVGLTPAETSRYIIRLHNWLNPSELWFA